MTEYTHTHTTASGSTLVSTQSFTLVCTQAHGNLESEGDSDDHSKSMGDPPLSLGSPIQSLCAMLPESIPLAFFSNGVCNRCMVISFS